jgi:hypothetical protein
LIRIPFCVSAFNLFISQIKETIEQNQQGRKIERASQKKFNKERKKIEGRGKDKRVS